MDTAQEYIDYINSDAFIVQTPQNGAVFYSNDSYRSGPHYNRERADSLTKQDDGSHIRLEQTKGGEWLEKENVYEKFGWENGDEVWTAVSEKYAAQASGDVTTRVVGAEDARIFRKTELPALLDNEKVTSINGIPREELARLHKADPEAAFNKVCEGELNRDRSAAEASGDAGGLDDVANREMLYAEQLSQQGRTPETATIPRGPFLGAAASQKATTKEGISASTSMTTDDQPIQSTDAVVESEKSGLSEAEVASKPEDSPNSLPAEAAPYITDDDQLWADFDKTAEREAEANTQVEILRERAQKEAEGLGH